MIHETISPGNDSNGANEEAVGELLQRLRGGDAEAAKIVFQRYAERLARIAKKYLSFALARRIDAEDVTQSVFRTFFRRLAQGEFAIANAQGLWRLLVKITVTKARAQRRQHRAAMRDARTEVAQRDDENWLIALATAPTASDAIALADAIFIALRDLPNSYAAILELRLRGFAVAEIAVLLQQSPRSIHRALKLLKKRLARTISPGE